MAKGKGKKSKKGKAKKGKKAKKDLADLVKEAVDKGADTAEDIHRAVADLPLTVLAEIGLERGPIKEVRRIQDLSIGAVYDLIREINQQVTQLAKDILGERA